MHDDAEEEKGVDFSIICLSLNDNKSIYILGLKQDLIYSDEILTKIKGDIETSLKDNKLFLGY